MFKFFFFYNFAAIRNSNLTVRFPPFVVVEAPGVSPEFLNITGVHGSHRSFVDVAGIFSSRRTLRSNGRDQSQHTRTLSESPETSEVRQRGSLHFVRLIPFDHPLGFSIFTRALLQEIRNAI
ncbi:hypothetical protein HanXRQr2_Chr04g0148501 [Helianthus annuus]|uniref:Uncharacterized protein n=1 Tax=Helianthus annuus TaxID=4232 RepID=A0A9K3J597_HELAN|nr:hypothetical protein HanXRQr2_Chr04g0148501 [Helianthus annuus]